MEDLIPTFHLHLPNGMGHSLVLHENLGLSSSCLTPPAWLSPEREPPQLIGNHKRSSGQNKSHSEINVAQEKKCIYSFQLLVARLISE